MVALLSQTYSTDTAPFFFDASVATELTGFVDVFALGLAAGWTDSLKSKALLAVDMEEAATAFVLLETNRSAATR